MSLKRFCIENVFLCEQKMSFVANSLLYGTDSILPIRLRNKLYNKFRQEYHIFAASLQHIGHLKIFIVFSPVIIQVTFLPGQSEQFIALEEKDGKISAILRSKDDNQKIREIKNL